MQPKSLNNEAGSTVLPLHKIYCYDIELCVPRSMSDSGTYYKFIMKIRLNYIFKLNIYNILNGPQNKVTKK